MALVIVLNGTSSAGKSSLTRALQAMSARPLLHVQMDSFLTMQPPQMNNHPDGFVFYAIEDASPPEIAIEAGGFGERLMTGMRAAIAGMADAGLDLVVDDVWLGGHEQSAYAQCLQGHEVFFVGVHAAFEIAEARERARGDRDIGQVRWQFDRVHRNTAYDLEVDTGADTTETVAQKIMDLCGLARA
jgi:chloramphenicol 3-O phosphotransferase